MDKVEVQLVSNISDEHETRQKQLEVFYEIAKQRYDSMKGYVTVNHPSGYLLYRYYDRPLFALVFFDQHDVGYITLCRGFRNNYANPLRAFIKTAERFGSTIKSLQILTGIGSVKIGVIKPKANLGVQREARLKALQYLLDQGQRIYDYGFTNILDEKKDAAILGKLVRTIPNP